ncbi:IS110 family transposase [Sphingomonas sp. 35-24ZXX]|uniref:IS110 family transposase n=1 Tax=Sphingomonas sp. 35-24ZXX TaxID=1545915 RepID=UPI0018CCD97C|nr:IS110 family transposase [Sphingomonas sp. 35-24ZXX]
MTDVHIFAIDLAKRSFQVCGIALGGGGDSIQPDGFACKARDHLARTGALYRCDGGMRDQPFCGRFAESLGHEVRLIPPIYVKQLVKRQKNDAEDAAAIAEAALRPNIHYVAVKSAEHQARAVAFRTHQSFVGQRTQLINAWRGHLASFGFVVAQGPVGIKAIGGMIDNDITQPPDTLRDIARLYLDQIALLTQKIDELHLKLRAAAKVDDAMRRLCTMPGVGPVTAGAIMAFASDRRAFAGGQNFAAWLGLVPRQRATGGKTRLLQPAEGCQVRLP